MNLDVALAKERRKREEAEAEVTRLQAQLAIFMAEGLAVPLLPSDAASILVDLRSQLKQTEQLLKDQRLVHQVIDTSPYLVHVVDKEGRCIIANESYTKFLAQQATLVQINEKPMELAPKLEWLETELPIAAISFEECYRLGDGQIIWYQTTKSPLLRNDGSRYVLTFSTDITDLKLAHKVAQESMLARQIFMANMSHEIRTPLHGVMGLAELLKKESLSAEQADYVEMIQASTENLLVVINDILDFAKIEAGQIKLENIPFNIIKTVQEAARSFTFKVNEKGLILRIVSENEGLPWVQGDPFRLHQILINLLSNAIKFTRQGSIIITIDAGQQVGTTLPITFNVADTGIGISADILTEVFNSFQQADSSVPRLYGGTGLGLTICKNLVELQGGQIGVRSELSQGSCFYFTIPYSVSDEPETQEPELVQSSSLLRDLTVLLAEDNAVNQLIAVSMLSQWHVKVEMAQNGEEALAKALQNKYDLILMDIQMPQIDGIEAASQLRTKANPNLATPIIALTADALRINAESCQALGFTDYLIKPYHEAALYELLRRVSLGGQALPVSTEAVQAFVDLELHYDFDMLGRLASDPEFICKMLELFIARVPGQVQALQQAIDQQDWQTIAREAHTLKITFGSLNIEAVTNLLKKLEALAALQASLKEMQPVIIAVWKATHKFCALFSAELSQLKPPS